MSEVGKFRLEVFTETIHRHALVLDENGTVNHANGWVSLADYDALRAKLKAVEEERDRFKADSDQNLEAWQQEVGYFKQQLAHRDARITELEQERTDYSLVPTDAELRDPEYMKAYCADFGVDYHRELLRRNKAETQLLQARAPLSWTTKRPTEEGWYWRKNDKWHDGYVVHMNEEELIGMVNKNWYHGGEWAGPLVPPGEGA